MSLSSNSRHSPVRRFVVVSENYPFRKLHPKMEAFGAGVTLHALLPARLSGWAEMDPRDWVRVTGPDTTWGSPRHSCAAHHGRQPPSPTDSHAPDPRMLELNCLCYRPAEHLTGPAGALVSRFEHLHNTSLESYYYLMQPGLDGRTQRSPTHCSRALHPTLRLLPTSR
jgi:hypothetical protein